MDKQLNNVARIGEVTGLSEDQVRTALRKLDVTPLASVGNQPVYRASTIEAVVKWNRQYGRKRRI